MLHVITSLMAGALTGLVFFGGLWWTVQKAVTSGAPVVWFLVSFLARMGIAVAGFYFASYGHWTGFLLCLAGFLAARVFVTKVNRI